MEKFKAIRKSSFMNYKQCPAKFKFNYDDPNYWNYGSTTDKSNMKTWRGNEFHAGMEMFFDKITFHLDNNKDNFRDALPQHSDSVVNGWFDWIANIELSRWKDLTSRKLGSDFMPIANELKVTAEDVIDRTGHIDRIDLIPGKKELCIVEYKAGESYDMDKIDRATSMNAEIGWYVQILEKIKKYPDYNITHWKVINPILEKIWINRISPISLRAVENTFEEMVNKIQNGLNFPKKISPLCYHCPYLQICDPFYGEEVELNFG